MIYYVYVYYDGDIPIYVGKGKNNRYKVHLKKFLNVKKGKIPFYDKLHKMKSDGKEPVIIIIEKNLSEEDALKKEKEYYKKFGTVFNGDGTLYNYNECGVKNPILKGKKNPMYKKSLFSVWVKKYGEDSANDKMKKYRKNMSKSTKGRKQTNVTKQKIQNQKQKYWDELSTDDKIKFKKTISESHTKKRKFDASQRMINLNKEMKGEKHPKSKKCLVEGKIYNSILEVCSVYNFKNHNTVRYRLNSDNFPEWKYLN